MTKLALAAAVAALFVAPSMAQVRRRQELVAVGKRNV